ncbi:MAG: sigma-70 family RNA polymerase sigma factor [Anaerolineae bacterium]|nr:sigma-70 family RNA polymerase sigma factor [Anaerolineae bacterium]
MAYPSAQIEDTDQVALLFEKDGSEQYLSKDDLAEIFVNGSADLKRLRLHYLEVGETQEPLNGETPIQAEADKPEEAAALEIRTPDIPPEAYTNGESVDPVGLYLKEMSRVPLLNTEQEVSLAKRIEKAKKADRKLAKLNGSSTLKDREKLAALIHDGGMARDHLIQANTRLVVSIAKKYLGRGVPFLDLIQEGNLGLMKAVKKYDYRRGFRFSTYATWWIRQTITRSIADQGRTIRVPVHMIDRIRLMYKTAHRLEQKLGHPPNVEELAEGLGMETNKVQWMLRVSWLPLSLESPVGDEEDSELGMFVEDTTMPSPGQAAYQNLLSEKVEQVLDTLSPREARILRLRFGMDNGTSYTLEEVGEKFGLTRERIRQIEGKALRRLRHPVRARQLREYL